MTLNFGCRLHRASKKCNRDLQIECVSYSYLTQSTTGPERAEKVVLFTFNLGSVNYFSFVLKLPVWLGP